MPKTNPSRLADRHGTLVLDASVVINILGTGRPKDVLEALGRSVLIEATTLREVRRDPYSNEPADAIMENLRSAAVLGLAHLSGPALGEFMELVSAVSPDDLGDGEAAAIAHAEDIDADLVTDDRKAIRIALSRRPDRHPLTSFDLLTSPYITNHLGEDAIELLCNALTFARMRVPREQRTWTIDRLGAERAQHCPSLCFKV